MFNRKIFTLTIFFFLLTATIPTPAMQFTNCQDTYLPCDCDGCCSHKQTNNKSNSDRPRFWTEENLKYLNDKEKEQLSTLQKKIKAGEKLTPEEKQQVWVLKDVIIKAKLGNEKFTDFKKLITKKKNGEKLTDSEITKLKSYFSEIKGD